MPQHIPETTREIIRTKIELGIPDWEIAREANVCERTIRRYKKNMKDYHSLHPPKEPMQGRPRTITEEMQEVFSELSLFSSTKTDS